MASGGTNSIPCSSLIARIRAISGGPPASAAAKISALFEKKNSKPLGGTTRVCGRKVASATTEESDEFGMAVGPRPRKTTPVKRFSGSPNSDVSKDKKGTKPTADLLLREKL